MLRLQGERPGDERQLVLLIIVLTVARRGGQHGVLRLSGHKK
ncbi:hypothetical protein RKG52_07610 [Klebsiella pneumoniae]|nr:hypothetical protein [Klebsiella pneumoniae]